MLTILITILTIFFISIYKEWRDVDVVISIYLGFIIGLIIAFALPAETKTVKKVEYIECLQDNNQFEGSFFLGSGTINGVWKYTYYAKYGNSYYLKQVDAHTARIRYTSSKPRIEYTETEQTNFNKGINLFALDLTDSSIKTIYIPKNSIKQHYNLDAR